MTSHTSGVGSGVWDRLVDRLWPLTLSIGILMTVVVFAFLAFSFCVVFRAAFLILTNTETWLHEQ